MNGIIWATIIAAGLLTYAQRLSLLISWQQLSLPEQLGRALRFVPVSVLVALIIPALFLNEGALFISIANGRLLAGLFAAVVAYRTRNVLLTIGAGMALLLLLESGFG